MNKHFSDLVDEKIDVFKTLFSSSKNIFYDPKKKNKTVHAGEYGGSRELICRNFLKNFIPPRLDISDGFLIGPQGNISKQSDIVIFDGSNTPLFQTDVSQKFFPLETVVAIGEIKSSLSKSKFKEALRVLANNKKMKRELKDPYVIYRHSGTTGEIMDTPRDHMISFLICESLKFQGKQKLKQDPETFFNDLYDGDIDVKDRHNLILSMNDGVFLYEHFVNGRSLRWHYPWSQNKKMKDLFISSEGSKLYFHSFAHYIFMLTQNATIFFPDIGRYLS